MGLESFRGVFLRLRIADFRVEGSEVSAKHFFGHGGSMETFAWDSGPKSLLKRPKLKTFDPRAIWIPMDLAPGTLNNTPGLSECERRNNRL